MTLLRGTEHAVRVRSLADLGTAGLGIATVANAGLAAVSGLRAGDTTTTLRLLEALAVTQVLLAVALGLTFGARALLSNVHDVRVATLGLGAGSIVFGLIALVLRATGGSAAVAPLATSASWCTAGLLLAAVLAGGVLIGRTHHR